LRQSDLIAEKYQRPAALTAHQAKSEAQKMAFSAISFEAAIALLRLGILQTVADAGDNGITAAEISKQLDLSEYGVKVLLDMGLTTNLVWLNDDQFVLDKVGHFLLEDPMTQANINFTQDVCYEAMMHLMDAVRSGTPAGLKVFGDWPTIYQGLTHLPEPVRKSWIEFNNYHSRRAFADALPIVLESEPEHILDIGGNTGAWAFFFVEQDANVRVTIVDMPEQASIASENIKDRQLENRIDTCAMNILDPELRLPSGADTLWMSQFLDCFPESEVLSILRKAKSVMNDGSSLFILEPFWDRQQFDAAAYSINATSLYFTCVANGTSRLFRSNDFIALVREAGFQIIDQHDGLGGGHTLLHLGCVSELSSEATCS